MKDLSIVIQGPVLRDKRLCQNIIDNIITTRLTFPISEIIVSTWEMDEESRQSFTDQLADYSIRAIYNIDPGPITYNERGAVVVCNLNRMIVSTREGIKHTSNPIVVKLRTDSCLYSRNLLNIVERHFLEDDGLYRETQYSVFSHRIINCSLFARDARGYRPYLFHPGDIMMVGYRLDLLKLFDIPLADESIFEVSSSKYFFSLMRYVPEQYIWVKCIDKVKGIRIFEGNGQRTKALVRLSEDYYIHNYIPYSCSQLGLRWDKYESVYASRGKFSIYRHRDWLRIYQRNIYGKVIKFSPGDHVRSVIITMLKMFFLLRTLLLSFPLVRYIAIRLVSTRRK